MLTRRTQLAGIPRKVAPTIGIAVDPRRQNLSEESLKENVARLQEYKKRLIVFPRRNGEQRQGDGSAADVKKAKQGGAGLVVNITDALAVVNVAKVDEVKLKDVEGEEAAYRKLRTARSDARYVGVREKRAKLKAEDELNKKK
jgi:large subunit ribosomal protein L13e